MATMRFGVEEHVLGSAEADALGAELAGHARASCGVSALARTAMRRLDVGPFHQRGELAGEFGLQHGDLALHHLAGRAVDGDRCRLSSNLTPKAVMVPAL